MSCASSWRIWIRQLVMTLYTLFLIITVVFTGIYLDKRDADAGPNVWGWVVGGMFVLFSLPISLWGILQHVTNYTKPFLQRHEIRIMLMVPIYGINSLLALRFPRAAIYLNTLRQCYEAYVLYNFVTYLLTYLWNSHPFLERELMCQPDVKHPCPCCCVKPWNGKQFLSGCKHGVVQYVVVRLITTALALIFELCGVYHDGDFRSDGAWTYLTIINAVSQTWAAYCLGLFYKTMTEELKPMKPLRKFLCIKFVLFLSLWQSIVISILVSTGVITELADLVVYDANKVSAGIQDFVICIEMFFAAIAHFYSFPHQPYIDETQQGGIGPFFQSLRHAFNVDDVTHDVRTHVRVVVGKAVNRTLGVRLPVPSYGSQATGDNVALIRYSKDLDDDSLGITLDYKPGESSKETDSLLNYTEFSSTVRDGDRTRSNIYIPPRHAETNKSADNLPAEDASQSADIISTDHTSVTSNEELLVVNTQQGDSSIPGQTEVSADTSSDEKLVIL